MSLEDWVLAANQSPVPDWQVVTEATGVLAIAPTPRTRHAIGAVLMAALAATGVLA